MEQPVLTPSLPENRPSTCSSMPQKFANFKCLDVITRLKVKDAKKNKKKV